MIWQEGAEGYGKEQREAELQKYSPWLGGVIEIGRGMGFSIYPRGRKVYAYPYIDVLDNDEDRVRFNMRFGGRVHKKHGKSWEWKVESDNAVDIALVARQYAPARVDTIGAFIAWRDAQSCEEKVSIAEDIKAIDRTKVTEGDYQGLIQDERFLAGILDERGNVYLRQGEASGVYYPHFHTASINKVLLDTLCSRYGGTVYTHLNKDLIRYTWESENKGEIKYLYTYAKDSLQFKGKIDPRLRIV